MKKILMTLCCAALSASAIELAAWRGETVTAKLPPGEKVGKAPAGLTVKVGVLQDVKFVTKPKGMDYAVTADRVLWDAKMDGQRVISVAGAADAKAESAARTDWKAQKEEEARRRRIRNELKRTEDLIGELEERDAFIDSQFELPEVSSSPEKLMALGQEKEEIAEKLAEAYEKWEALSSEAETF